MERKLWEPKVGVQFITHRTECYDYLEGAQMALKGGCCWIQLRMKDAPLNEVEEMAHSVQNLCRSYGAVFIIDDHVELVKKIGADGVHLGKNDMPVDAARRILGSDFIIGGTANTFDDIRRLHQAGADYIGCGPFRFTTTKKNLSPVLGFEGYRDITRQMRQHNIDLPIVAIGGITLSFIDGILETGVSGIALSGGVLNDPDPVAMMEQVVSAMR